MHEFSFSKGSIKVEMADGVSFEGLINDGNLIMAQESLSVGVMGDVQDRAIHMVPEVSFYCTMSCVSFSEAGGKIPEKLLRLIRV